MKKCPLRAYSGIGGEKMGNCADGSAKEGKCAWYIHEQCAIALIGSVSFERMSLYGKSKGYSHHVTFGPDPDDMEARLATIGQDDEAISKMIDEGITAKPLPEETDEAVVEDPPEPDAVTDAEIEDEKGDES